jgi:hypothetical protein
MAIKPKKVAPRTYEHRVSPDKIHAKDDVGHISGRQYQLLAVILVLHVQAHIPILIVHPCGLPNDNQAPSLEKDQRQR